MHDNARMDSLQRLEVSRHPRTFAVVAAAVADASLDEERAPGGLFIVEGRVAMIARPKDVIAAAEAAQAPTIRCMNHVVTAAFINAHTHLDLSSISPFPYGGEFAQWLMTIRSKRPTTLEAIDLGVRRGIGLSVAGGACAVGDIAGLAGHEDGRTSHAACDTLMMSGYAGVTFAEFFGTGERQETAIANMGRLLRRVAPAVGLVRLGISPHAPYSCGDLVYRHAFESGLPVATHLAESPDECDACMKQHGPLVQLQRSLGIAPGLCGAHPVEVVTALAAGRPFLAVHATGAGAYGPHLRAAGATVVYCPRATAYFGHEQAWGKEHPWRELADQGVNVALGTDGLPCLDRSDRISVLDEIQFLMRAGEMNARRLLRMATVNGAAALGLAPGAASLTEGSRPLGILALELPASRPESDLLAAAFRHAGVIRWIEGGPARVNVA